LEDGEVIILVTKGTRDEVYRWSSFRKQNKMQEILKTLKDRVALQNNTQKTLAQFPSKEKKDLVIYADHREKSSRVLKGLMDEKLEQLDVGDYVLSDDVCVNWYY